MDYPMRYSKRQMKKQSKYTEKSLTKSTKRKPYQTNGKKAQFSHCIREKEKEGNVAMNEE